VPTLAKTTSRHLRADRSGIDGSVAGGGTSHLLGEATADERPGWTAHGIRRSLAPPREPSVVLKFLRPVNLERLRGIRGLEAPRFGLGTHSPALMTGEELVERTGPLLAAFCASHPYDSVAPVESFLDRLDVVRRAKPKARAAEVFAQESWFDDCDQQSCVGFSQSFAQQLRTAGLPAEVGGAELPGLYAHPVGHAFSYVRFQNPKDASDRGIVLLDPYSGRPEIVRAGHIGYSEVRKAQMWLDRDEASFWMVTDGGHRNRWHLRPWLNPEASLLRHTEARTMFRLRAFDTRGGLRAWLNLNMGRREVTIGVTGAGGQSVERKLCFDDRQALSPLLLEDDFATALGIPRTNAESPGQVLWRRVTRVMDREGDFREIRGVYDEVFQ
jgi:hypothetical protein